MAIFGVEERELDKRVAEYSTQVSMAKTRISYGNLKPADVLQHLSAVCTDALTGCNYEDTDPLTIPSEMYVNSVTIPVSGHLTLNPKGVFAQGNGSAFVDCVVKTAPYGTQVSPFEVVGPTLCGCADPGILSQGLQPWPCTRTCLASTTWIQAWKIDADTSGMDSARQNHGIKLIRTQRVLRLRTLSAQHHSAPWATSWNALG